jgi:hypothetical protein
VGSLLGVVHLAEMGLVKQKVAVSLVLLEVPRAVLVECSSSYCWQGSHRPVPCSWERPWEPLLLLATGPWVPLLACWGVPAFWQISQALSARDGTRH